MHYYFKSNFRSLDFSSTDTVDGEYYKLQDFPKLNIFIFVIKA